MQCRRIFIDWNKPFLKTALDLLINESADNKLLDLSNSVLILPTRHAGRRLTELLVSQVEVHGLELIPPRIITLGTLHELLIEPKLPFATDEIKLSAWLTVISEASTATFEKLGFHGEPPKTISASLPFARIIKDLYEEVGKGGISFLEVADLCRTLTIDGDQELWLTLNSLREQYLKLLSETAYSDPHYEMQESAKIDENYKIYTVGVPEISAIHKKLLKSFSAFIFAPEAEADCFDEYGCVITKKFTGKQIALLDSQLLIESSPIREAFSVCNFLNNNQQRLTNNQISIGSVSDKTTKIIVDLLNAAGVNAFDPAGLTFKQSSIGSLLLLLQKFLITGLYKDFASLLRHPYLIKWSENSELIGKSDKLYSEHLYFTFDIKDNFIKPLLLPFINRQQSLSNWSEVIGEFIAAVYQGQVLADDNATNDALIALKDALEKLPIIEKNVDAVDALTLLFEISEGSEIHLSSDKNDLPVLGWLDLLLDDAETVCLVGCNEGNLPAPFPPNPFLSDGVRYSLNLENNASRLARDTYIFEGLVNSKKSLSVSASKHNLDGELLMLSRVLYQTDDQSLLGRIKKFTESKESVFDYEKTGSLITIGKPEKLSEAINTVAVSSLSDYVTCPFFFYQKNILKLRSLDDKANELSALQFGSVLHIVLDRFFKNSLSTQTDKRQISKILLELLDEQLEFQFGENAVPSIYLQKVSLKERLLEFADWHVDWLNAGWINLKTEYDFRWLINNTSRPVTLTGRIDRIDYNPAENKLLIIDYKSSDNVTTPENKHRENGAWLNFQLPLYRAFLAAEKPDFCPETASFVTAYLPLSVGRTKIMEAKWREDEYEEAVTTAFNIVEEIIAENFWPPKEDFNL